MSLYDKIDKALEEQNLLEMAKVGITDDSYEVYIYSHDPGNIPHFHYVDSASLGKDRKKGFHTCIRIDSAEYFHHGDKTDMLSKKQKKELVKFLQAPSRNKRYRDHWEQVLSLWNDNSSTIEIDENLPMPDYNNLK